MVSLTKDDLREIIEETVASKIEDLEKQLSYIKNTMTAQYLNSIGRLLEREAKDTINNFACDYHNQTENHCKNMLKEYISKYTNALAMGDLANAFSVLNEFERVAGLNAADTDKGMGCKNDWTEISRILKRHKDVAKDISAQFTSRKVPADIGELDFSPQEMYDNVIFPLSHSLRIQITHSLKSGSKRFTTLKNELNVKNTGLLVHHLKPLTEAGLVDQDYRKEYSLTDKGFMVARYFAQIAAAMHPEEAKTVTIGSHPHITKLEVVNN